MEAWTKEEGERSEAIEKSPEDDVVSVLDDDDYKDKEETGIDTEEEILSDELTETGT